SLAAVWRAAGVRVAGVVGHSQGEVAAAYVAGALSLADAARVVAVRSRLVAEVLSGRGGMASVSLPERDVRGALPPGVTVAAVNSPGSVVVSGDDAALDELLASWSADGVRARRIAVDYASHSRQVDSLAGRLRDELAGISPRQADVAFYSTVTGDQFDTSALDADYWYRNLREPVLFSRAVNTALAAGQEVFVESSPHPVLVPRIEEIAEAVDAEVLVVASVRRDEAEAPRLLASLSRVFAAGVPVDWTRVTGAGAVAELPTYAFQRARYWPELVPAETAAGAPTDSWWYRVGWAPVPEAPARLTGTWLVLLPENTRAEWPGVVTGSLAGLDVDVVEAIVDGASREKITAQVQEALGSRLGAVHGVVSLVAADGRSALAKTVAVAQALAGAGVRAPLWCLTTGAVAVTTAEPVPNPDHALLWGLGRVAAQEWPDGWGGLVDLPVEIDAKTLRSLIHALSGQTGEDQLAVRPAGLFGARLRRAPRPSQGRAWEPRGTVLVTGAAGAHGERVVRWLAAGGARHVVLTGVTDCAAELRRELTALGVGVTATECDLADRVAVARLLGGLPGDLTAVVHTDGVLDDALLHTLTPDQVEAVLRPKVDGARNLHELTEDRDLEAFVLFSSAAAVLGNPGQANYAPGNAYLDALAAHRRGRGLPATSVAWGHWAGVGPAGGPDDLKRQVAPDLDPELALTALGPAVGGDEPAPLVVDIDWTRIGGMAGATRLFDLIPDLRRTAQDIGEISFADRLGRLSRTEQRQAVVDLVRAQAAVVLGHPSGESVEPGSAFKEIGFDSVRAVELRNRLAAATGLKLPATLVFDHPSAAELAAHLAAQLIGPDGPDRLYAAVDALARDVLDPALDQETRNRLRRRLEGVLGQLRSTRTGGEAADEETVRNADDDELIALVTKELGTR
ncbi:SDR family NAD(P)-dependent oxidoreductase, partial [Amycolatopsis sp. NPDC058278]|uniref:type I polyketide synthase n=1 Tax=Amycolatopsis sp. NPDC058278 TaxID=3346417 RepID=UPI0036DA82D4